MIWLLPADRSLQGHSVGGEHVGLRDDEKGPSAIIVVSSTLSDTTVKYLLQRLWKWRRQGCPDSRITGCESTVARFSNSCTDQQPGQMQHSPRRCGQASWWTTLRPCSDNGNGFPFQPFPHSVFIPSIPTKLVGTEIWIEECGNEILFPLSEQGLKGENLCFLRHEEVHQVWQCACSRSLRNALEISMLGSI